MSVEKDQRIETMDIEQQDEHNDYLMKLPPWQNHITVRGLVASLIIGVIYSVVVMKLDLTTGLIPNLNVSATLLSFVFICSCSKLLEKDGIVSARSHSKRTL